VEQPKVEKPAVDLADAYDYVPVDRIKEVSERLKYIEELITTYGRAYDYRLNTSTKLKAILKKLEDERELQAKRDNQLDDKENETD
jgi:hypothetical protein